MQQIIYVEENEAKKLVDVINASPNLNSFLRAVYVGGNNLVITGFKEGQLLITVSVQEAVAPTFEKPSLFETRKESSDG